MSELCNYHTHSTFCDGRNTPAEMAAAACAKGFDTLGFSSHAMFPTRESHTLDPARASEYVSSIRDTADEYRGRMRILCALEADYVRGVTDPDRSRYANLGLDYIIGSVHYVVAPDGEAIPADHTPAILSEGIRDHFGGDVRAFITGYHEALREMVSRYDFDIVGHPDLYRKFNVKSPYFDENAEWHRELVAETAEAIAASGKLVEVNTGAIGRKWLDDAYPSSGFRALLRARGVRFVLDSDSHSTDTLDAGFAAFGVAEDYVRPF